MQTLINNNSCAAKTLLNTISSHKVLPANQVNKNNLLIRPIGGGINRAKEHIDPKLSKNSIHSPEQSPNRKNDYIKSLKDRIFSPEDDSSSSNINSKNQIALAELSKRLLSSPLISKTPELPSKSKSISSSMVRYLPDKSSYALNRKTLILDLDETLVHSNFKSFYGKSDIVLNIFFDQKSHTIHVLKRPHVDEFLDKMSRLFELVIFTASIPEYANPLLNKLDPHRRITHRLFREHCTASSNYFIKDLRKVGRNLKDTILLDNNPVSYALNKENGLPILTWHSNKNDTELLKLVPLLEHLAKVDDVRDVIKKVISNNFINHNEVNRLIGSKEEEKNNNQILNNTVNYSLSNGISSLAFGSKTVSRFYFDEKEKKAQNKEVELFHDFFDTKTGTTGNLLLDKKYQEKYDMFYEVKDKGKKINKTNSNDLIMPSNSLCNYKEKENRKSLLSNNNPSNNSVKNQDELYTYLKLNNNDFLSSFSNNTNSTLTSFYKTINAEVPSIQSKLNQLSNYSIPKRDKEISKNGSNTNSNSHSKVSNSLNKFIEKRKFDFSSNENGTNSITKGPNHFTKKATISLQEQHSNTNSIDNTNANANSNNHLIANDKSPYSQLINWDLNIYPLKSVFTKEENKNIQITKNAFAQEKNRNLSQK